MNNNYIINLLLCLMSFFKVIIWPLLIGFIILMLRKQLVNILSALAEMITRINSISLTAKEFTLIMTSSKTPETSKILLTEHFILQENKIVLLEILAQVVNALADVKVYLKNYNGLYPSKADAKTRLKSNLLVLRDRLEIAELLNEIKIQDIINQLEQQSPSIKEQNNSIINALSFFDPLYFNKKPEDFDLIIKIRKRILENSKM